MTPPCYHISIIIDRPLGSRHPKHSDLIYPINYGFIPRSIAPDGEEQDVYVLGVDRPIESFVGRIIAVIHRSDDVEEKWVTAPEGMSFSVEQIEKAVEFQERFFDSTVTLVN